MTGVLAFGSLRTEPGCELSAAIIERRPVTTPFPVEYARYSDTRGGAPTLVPVDSGSSVEAEILVLRDDVTTEKARNMLWRRETRRVCSKKCYQRPVNPGPNHVLVEKLSGFEGLSTVVYTDFTPEGKVEDPDPRQLAVKAVQSVEKAKPCRDGITYLINAKAAGVVTRLTAQYEKEILQLTGASTLAEARGRGQSFD